jgi:hypothetical protein
MVGCNPTSTHPVGMVRLILHDFKLTILLLGLFRPYAAGMVGLPPHPTQLPNLDKTITPRIGKSNDDPLRSASIAPFLGVEHVIANLAGQRSLQERLPASVDS